jgi:FkbM family methyltransferase
MAQSGADVATGQGAIILDVGAHVGETALSFNAQFPRATIHSFEPIKRIYLELESNCRSREQIHCHNLALGSMSAQLTIALPSTSVQCQTNQISTLADDSTPPQLKEVVVVMRLDEFCAREGITGVIAILKLDVEGYELEVLKGAGPLLRSGRICHIIAEASLDPYDQQHSHYSDLEQYLNQFGYRCIGFYESGYREKDAEMCYTNAVFKPTQPVSSNENGRTIRP